MIALFDLDSLIYNAKYKIEELEVIQELSTVVSEEKLYKEIINQSIHRLENMYLRILNEIEETGILFEGYEFYVTICQNSFRKKIDPNYKANRTFDKLRSDITKQFHDQTDYCYGSDTLEADDLIADRIKELESNEYIIISIDKDVLSLEGLHFNYYRKPSKKDEPINDMVGLGHNDKEESKQFLAYQMLVGDTADNIKCLKGIGDKKAKGILKGKTTDYSLFRTVVSKYYEFGITRERLKTNYRLLKLGSD